MTAALRKTGTEIGDVVLLLDETSQALTFNRRLLDATLENITQGVSVVDSSQRLIGWNSRYEQLMNYPPGMVHVGESIVDLIRFNGEQGRFGNTDVNAEVNKRIKHIRSGTPYRYQSNFIDGKVIEISGQPMPGGGYVTTYTDITDSKMVESELVEAKALLDAAERLFSDQGFESTSLRQITTEAGANLAAVNYHFGSKENLSTWEIPTGANVQTRWAEYQPIVLPSTD